MTLTPLIHPLLIHRGIRLSQKKKAGPTFLFRTQIKSANFACVLRVVSPNLLPQGRVLARLWQASLADRLTEEYYAARLAGLAANCASTVAGISLSFSGYSDPWDINWQSWPGWLFACGRGWDRVL